MTRPTVGISSCLVGELVRYDGGHRKQDDLLQHLSPHVTWKTICPEVEAGLGLPRPPMQVREARLIVIEDNRDVTDTFMTFTRRKIEEIEKMNLKAYIFKARSPSCSKQFGLFAKAFKEAFPDTPVYDEEDLLAPEQREIFLTQILKRG